MLNASTVAEVQRRLGRKQPIAEIARQMAVSRWSVYRIKFGTHRHCKNTIGRCPKCGGQVQLPCRACELIANTKRNELLHQLDQSRRFSIEAKR